MPEPYIPSVSDLLWPTLVAVRHVGHSGTIEEIDEQVIEAEAFSSEQQSVLHNNGPRSKIEYRLAWARSRLKGMDLLDNSTRGVWTTTEAGRSVDREGLAPLVRDYRTRLTEARRDRALASVDSGEVAEETAEDDEPFDWRGDLLGLVLGMAPDGFERLAQRLLRAAGFINTTVTGRSGDGGIDGVGVYRLSLVSFPVFFQCKRYRGSVGPEKVRDFRGAMAGRGDKGLLITTGTLRPRPDARRHGTVLPPSTSLTASACAIC